MKSKSPNKIFRAVINAVLVIILAPLFVSLFIDSPYILSVQELFGRGTVSDTESDCVTFLNVGEGDAVLIRSNGRYVLVDTGDGESTDIIRSLKQNGVKGLDALILTHWHTDHTGGAVDVLREFPVLNVVMPQFPNPEDNTYSAASKVNSAAEKAGVRFTTATQGLAVNVGDFRLTVLYYNPENKDENNRSVVVMAKCRNIKFLLMADAEEELENEIIDYGIDLDCDVLKVGHHGSDTSTSFELIKAASPKYAVISVGLKNEHGHPDSSVLSRLYSEKIKVYRTDTVGELDVYVLEDGLDFSSELIN